MFVIINLPRDPRARQFSSKIFLPLIFLSGFAANLLVLLGWAASDSPKRAWGASGVVYSAAGACLASAIASLNDSVRELSKPGVLWKKLVKLGSASVIVVALVWFVVQDPRAFLNVAPGVGVYAHFWGFLIGLFSFLGLSLAKGFRRF